MQALQSQVIQQFTDTINKIPFNRILGLTLDSIAADHIVMSFNMKEDLIGNFHAWDFTWRGDFICAGYGRWHDGDGDSDAAGGKTGV